MKSFYINIFCILLVLYAVIAIGKGQVFITGNEEPLTIGLPRDINCTWGGSGNVSTMEWFIVGLEDGAFETATETNSVVLSLNPDDSGLDGAMFLCRVTLSSGQTAEETIALRVEAIENTVTITEETNATAGEPYTLICTVSSARPSNLTWIDPNGVACPLDHPHTTLTYSGWEAGSSRLELSFYSIRTSQSGTYKCVSNIGYPTSKSEATFVVVIQIPEPNVTIQRNPEHPVQLFTTNSLVLKCVIELIPEVDSYVTINSQWRGHSSLTDRQRRVIVSELEGVRLLYTTSVTFSTLRSADSGSYICSATVNPEAQSSHLLASDTTQESITISVVLKVTINVTYNPPSDFDLSSPPYYRPASPVTLTCRAHHASGSVTYRWSSTCSNCFARSGTSQSVSSSYLQSLDAGVHTCTARDSSGNSGSNSTEVRLIGSGMYVVYSSSFRNRAVANNSYIVSGSRSSSYINVYCFSNSTSGGTTYIKYPNGVKQHSTSDYYDYRVYQQSYTGVQIYGTYSSPDIYGIFTCEIPDSTGNILETSIGIYSSTPSTPSVYRISYTDRTNTQGSVLGMVDCFSQNSPPTTVIWTRDGITIQIDGENYDMWQIVIERQSYFRYKNTLFIKNAAQLAGNHSFCCRVSNDAGRSSADCVSTTWRVFPSVSIVPVGDALTSEPYEITCRASLQPSVATHLIQYLVVNWSTSNNQSIGQVGSMRVNPQQQETNGVVKSLMFEPLEMENGGDYTCNASLVFPGSAGVYSSQQEYHLNVLNWTIFQIKFGPVVHCSKWYEDKHMARHLDSDIKLALADILEKNCSCGFISSYIVEGEFSCRDIEDSYVVYRARLTGSSDTQDLPSLLEVINDWKTNDGTFLYTYNGRMRLGLDTHCPLEITSFSQPECGKYTQPASSGVNFLLTPK